MRTPVAKNQPVLLRYAFPKSDTGAKTGTGSLAASVSLGLTSGGTTTSPVTTKAARLLQPIGPRGAQILLSSGGSTVPGPKTGTGALSFSATIAGVSAGRNFYDLGTGDVLSVTANVANSQPVGVNWTGTGALSSTHSTVNSPKIGRNGTGALVIIETLVGTGTQDAPTSPSGTGALSASPSISATVGISWRGSGVLASVITISSTSTLKKASAGDLVASFSVSGSGSSTVHWNKKTKATTSWTTIQSTRSSN